MAPKTKTPKTKEPGSERLFKTIPDEIKEKIYGIVNAGIHDDAFIWQLIEQGDPEEALTAIESAKKRYAEILALLEPHRLAPATVENTTSQPVFKVGEKPLQLIKRDPDVVLWMPAKNGKSLLIPAGSRLKIGDKNFQTLKGGSLALGKLVPGTDVGVCVDRAGKIKVLDADKIPEKTHPIGGFHVDLDGSINPYSLWDLNFRCKGTQRGMTLVDDQFWYGIYLMGQSGGSKAEVAPADGYKFLPEGQQNLNWDTAVKMLEIQLLGLPSRKEFTLACEGVKQGLAIGEKPKLTGYFEGLRSKWGVQQATGSLWQWSRDTDGEWRYVMGGAWYYGGYAGPSCFSNSFRGYGNLYVGVRARGDHLIIK